MNYKIDESLKPSYFRGVNSKQPVPIEWNRVVEIIRNNEDVRQRTLESREARRLGDNKRADDLKAKCGAITVSAYCEDGHAKKNIKGLTGKLALDFDHIPVDRMAEVEKAAKEDAHTFLCYVTNSGNGLRIIVRYALSGDAATYQDAYRQAARYYENWLGVEADYKTRDESRLSFLSHDPEAVLQPQASRFDVFGLSLIDKAREEVEKAGYKFVAQHRNEYVWRVAVWLRDHEVDLLQALRMTKAAFEKDYPDTEAVVRSVYENNPHDPVKGVKSSKRTSGPAPKDVVSPIKNYLSAKARLRRNAVTREIEYYDDENGWCLLSDTKVNSLWVHMNEEGFTARIDDLWNVIRSDAVPEYHPFREYIDALPVWNPDTDPDYIGQLAARVHVSSDHAFFENCFRKWFVGILASLFTDATNHVILVFLGRQGIYKTTFFQRLLPPEWQKRYFYTKTNSQVFDKDDKIVMANNVLINLEEIDRISPNELNQLKAFITEKNISVRPPYGHAVEHYRHIASYCGTGNNLRFLTDTTGNRRWLPFEVLSIDNPYEYTLPYEGLYAQAYYLLQSGYSYWFTQDEINTLAVHNAEYEAPNDEESLILKYFRKPLPGETGVFLTATDIVDYVGALTTIRTLSSVKVGKALSKLGFNKCAFDSKYGYMMVKLNLEAISQEALKTGSESDVPF